MSEKGIEKWMEKMQIWDSTLSTKRQAQKWLKEILLCCTLQQNKALNRNCAKQDEVGIPNQEHPSAKHQEEASLKDQY